MSVSYSDDYGATGRLLHSDFHPRLGGLLPMMIVDNDPSSISYGTVYVTYNWLASSAGPGLRLMAKPLTGPWTSVEIPVVGLAGYPAHNRIGYRVTPVAGGALVAWYESDLRAFPAGDILSDGSSSNIGEPVSPPISQPGMAMASSRRKINLGRECVKHRKPVARPTLAISGGGGLRRRSGDGGTNRILTPYLAVSNGSGHILSRARRIRQRRSGPGRIWARGFKPVLALEPTSPATRR